MEPAGESGGPEEGEGGGWLTVEISGVKWGITTLGKGVVPHVSWYLRTPP